MSSPRREAWKTFHVSVVEVRGHAVIRGVVSTSYVTGSDHRPYTETAIWNGDLGRREPGGQLTVEEAAEMAVRAIREAFPGLF